MIDPAGADRGQFQPFLLTGERLLWTGRPTRGAPFNCSGLAFGLVFLGFACFWTFFSYVLAGEIWFSAFGIPFILAGLFMVFGRPLLNLFVRKRTIYAVTDRRLLRLTGPRLDATDLDDVAPLNLTEGANRVGSIFFNLPQAWPAQGVDLPVRRPQGLIASFDNIANVRTVYELIRKEAERLRRDPA